MLYLQEKNFNYFTYLIDTLTPCEELGTVKRDAENKNNYIIKLNYKNEADLIRFTGYDLKLLIDNIIFWCCISNFKILFKE